MGPQEAIAAFWPLSPTDGSDAATGDEIGAEVDDELRAFANGLVRGTLARVEEIDQLLAAHAHNWRVERMAVIDRLVLRLAVCELLTQPETPPKVIINEALELARTFSGDERWRSSTACWTRSEGLEQEQRRLEPSRRPAMIEER